MNAIFQFRFHPIFFLSLCMGTMGAEFLFRPYNCSERVSYTVASYSLGACVGVGMTEHLTQAISAIAWAYIQGRIPYECIVAA